MIRELETKDQFDQCFDVYRVLRPHLQTEGFSEKIQRQYEQGFRIAAVDEGGRIVALVGYRFFECTAWGHVLYIDDLITDPQLKRRGYGSQLLDWVIQRARERQCDEVHLDTGHTRFDAHRLYLNKGFQLNCHHLALKV